MSPAKQRQSAMKALGGHMKAIGAVAKGKVAHSAATAVHAQAIHEISQYLGLLYPAGSGGEETRAKPEIWSDSSGFSAKIDDFAAVTPFLVAAAKTGNAGAIGAGLRQVGKACGGCHKPYRKPKKK
jgi:cytochrome c556